MSSDFDANDDEIVFALQNLIIFDFFLKTAIEIIKTVNILYLSYVLFAFTIIGRFKVKKNIWMILVGVTVMHVAVFSALFVSSGCAKNEVMGERKFVPSAGGEAPMVAPQTGAPQVTPMAPAPVVDAPKTAEKAPVVKKEYEAMKFAGSSKPVTSTASHSSSAATAAAGSYEVKSGDTIGKIANAHGVSMAALLKANNLTKETAGKLKVGQKIVIPGKSVAASAKADDKVSVKAPAAKSTEAAPAAKDSGNSYTVKAGDSIPKIAKSLGVKEADLKKVNNLSDAATKQLKIGQKLIIPGKEGAADTAAVTAPVTETVAPVAPAATATSAAGTTATATTPAAPAAGATIDAGDPSTPVQLTKDMTIEEFAAEQKTTVDKIRALNQDLDKSGKLKSGQIVFVP